MIICGVSKFTIRFKTWKTTAYPTDYVYFWNYFNILKREKKTVMYQCSYCTAGSAFCSHDVNQKCTKCGVYTPHICTQCILSIYIIPKTCFLCTQRDHICLSKCLGGCIQRVQIKCKCTKGPIRLRVQKQNHNNGRYFWTCHDCTFFQWEEWN